MTKRSLLVSLGLLAFHVHGFSQEVFQRVYGGQSYDFGCEVIQTPDDGYLIAGSTGSFGLESAEIMVIKTDPDGYVEWRRYYGGPYADQAESMELTEDGNVIIGGFTERTGKSYQAYALKLTMDGDTIWSKHYGGALWDFAREVLPLTDGGYALFGQTYSYGEGEGDFYLIRLDSEGDTLWTKTYGGPQLESGESIALASDGGFFLAGYTESFGAGKKDVYVVRTDADGDTIWTRTYGGVEDDFGYAVVATNDDGFVVVGGTFNNPNSAEGDGDFMMQKADADGNHVWLRVRDKNGEEYWMDAIEDQVGDITVVGYTTKGIFGKEDARITGVDANGYWNGVAKTHGSMEDDRAYAVKETSDNGYIMVGRTDGFLNRFDDVYLVKMNYEGHAAPPELGVNEIEVDGSSYEVTIGPNPFYGSPTIFIQNYNDLVTKLDDPIVFRLFNAVGQKLLETEISSGNTRIELEVSSGIYSYQLVSGRSLLATGVAAKLN